MSNVPADAGLTPGGLWIVAWLLGLGATAAVFRLVSFADEADRVQAEHLVWALLGAIAAAFSACAATLAGIKNSEQRLADRLDQRLGAPDAPAAGPGADPR